MTRSRDVASGIIIGTTANRPTGFQGQLYFDTTENNLYQKNSFAWVVAGDTPAYTSQILVVAGGGGGGGNTGGGGGAGGLLVFTNQSLLPNTNYTVTVGAGGAGGKATNISDGTPASNGADSRFGALTLVKGGGGGGSYSSNNPIGGGSAGGSGGGGGISETPIINPGGAATPAGQGFPGSSGWVGPGYAAGSGGGAASAATNASANNAGNPGIGFTSALINTMGAATSSGQNISGTYYYAGGGAGGQWNTAQKLGGYGGGGNGAFGNEAFSLATPGTANTGGGGGGGDRTVPSPAGGSGIVIVQYPDTFPDITTIAAGLTYTRYQTGGFKYYKFTSGTGTVTI